MIVRCINSCAATASKSPRSNVLEALGEAAYTRDRVSYLRRANLGIEKLRFFFRHAADLHHLGGRVVEAELGRELVKRPLTLRHAV